MFESRCVVDDSPPAVQSYDAEHRVRGGPVQYFSRIDALKTIAQDTIYIISSVRLTKVRAESVDS
jgi:hypothetical protein